MKQLIPLALVVLFAACGTDQKTDITAKISMYKDSLGMLEKRKAQMLDEITSVQARYTTLQVLDSTDAIDRRQAREKAEMYVKEMVYIEKINALKKELTAH